MPGSFVDTGSLIGMEANSGPYPAPLHPLLRPALELAIISDKILLDLETARSFGNPQFL